MEQAIYAGSFDPFHIGHLEIVRKASRVFNVIILIADNSGKSNQTSAEERKAAIVDALNRHAVHAKVEIIHSLVADYAKDNMIDFSIRGLRDVVDFGQEEQLARYNKEIYPFLETVYFRADNFTSSSFVRELIKYGKDVSGYLP